MIEKNQENKFMSSKSSSLVGKAMNNLHDSDACSLATTEGEKNDVSYESVVICKEIDIQDELYKIKEEDDDNVFKILSISFYDQKQSVKSMNFTTYDTSPRKSDVSNLTPVSLSKNNFSSLNMPLTKSKMLKPSLLLNIKLPEVYKKDSKAKIPNCNSKQYDKLFPIKESFPLQQKLYLKKSSLKTLGFMLKFDHSVSTFKKISTEPTPTFYSKNDKTINFSLLSPNSPKNKKRPKEDNQTSKVSIKYATFENNAKLSLSLIRKKLDLNKKICSNFKSPKCLKNELLKTILVTECKIIDKHKNFHFSTNYFKKLKELQGAVFPTFNIKRSDKNPYNNSVSQGISRKRPVFRNIQII